MPKLPRGMSALTVRPRRKQKSSTLHVPLFVLDHLGHPPRLIALPVITRSEDTISIDEAAQLTGKSRDVLDREWLQFVAEVNAPSRPREADPTTAALTNWHRLASKIRRLPHRFGLAEYLALEDAHRLLVDVTRPEDRDPMTVALIDMLGREVNHTVDSLPPAGKGER